jgi:hypothetical protein
MIGDVFQSQRGCYGPRKISFSCEIKSTHTRNALFSLFTVAAAAAAFSSSFIIACLLFFMNDQEMCVWDFFGRRRH